MFSFAVSDLSPSEATAFLILKRFGQKQLRRGRTVATVDLVMAILGVAGLRYYILLTFIIDHALHRPL